MVVRRSGQQGRGDPALSRSPARLARAWRRHGRAPRRRRAVKTLAGARQAGAATCRDRQREDGYAVELAHVVLAPVKHPLPGHGCRRTVPSPLRHTGRQSAPRPRQCASATPGCIHNWPSAVPTHSCGGSRPRRRVPTINVCAVFRSTDSVLSPRRRGIQKNGAKTKNAGASCKAARERWGGPLPRLAPWGPARGPLASGCLQQRRAGTRSCGACPARRPHGQAQARGRRAVPRALRAASSAASAAQSTCAAAGPRGRGACARCVRGVCAKRSGAGLLTPRREQAAELFQRGGGGGVAAGRAVGHAAGGCRRGCLF